MPVGSPFLYSEKWGQCHGEMIGAPKERGIVDESIRVPVHYFGVSRKWFSKCFSVISLERKEKKIIIIAYVLILLQ